METSCDLIKQLRDNLPIAFARKEIDRLLPGVISPKTLANLSSQGDGPPAYHQGRTVFYNRDAFLEWLSKRIS